MIEVKFHKGLSAVYDVSAETFKTVTKEQAPYVQSDQAGKNAYGICPLCENPVKLLGVYAKLKKQEPHARHYKHDIKDLADFSEYKYLRCPYHKKKADYVMEIRRPEEMDTFNAEILKLAHDYFDKCIYILQKETGLIISDALAKEIAIDYMMHPGYMTYDITRNNVPYIMSLCMAGKNLVKRVIRENSPLYEMLKDKPEVTLVQLSSKPEYKSMVPVYRIESNVGFLNLSFNISNYRYTSDYNTRLHEYLKLHIGIPDGKGTYELYAQKEIEVDPFYFPNLIRSKKSNIPPAKQTLKDIADEILVIK